MIQENSNINFKRKYYDLSWNSQNLKIADSPVEQHLKKQIKRVPDKREAISKFVFDGLNDLTFDDLINLDDDQQNEEQNLSQQKLELYDSDGEIAMQISTDEQLAKLLVQQNHLTLEQKLQVCHNFSNQQQKEILQNAKNICQKDESLINEEETGKIQNEMIFESQVNSLTNYEIQQITNECYYGYVENNYWEKYDDYQNSDDQDCIQIIDFGNIDDIQLLNNEFEVEEQNYEEKQNEQKSFLNLDNTSNYIQEENEDLFIFDKSYEDRADYSKFQPTNIVRQNGLIKRIKKKKVIKVNFYSKDKFLYAKKEKLTMKDFKHYSNKYQQLEAMMNHRYQIC